MTVLFTQWHGADALEITFKDQDGDLGQRMVFRTDEGRIEPAKGAGPAFDADPEEFEIAAEAQRIQLAGLYDPMLAVATSDVEPLPHQIRAVYGDLLPRTPLRFRLADDSGAGTIIMRASTSGAHTWRRPGHGTRRPHRTAARSGGPWTPSPTTPTSSTAQ